MRMNPDHLVLMAAMALSTYLIRMLPMMLFHKRIKSRFARSFFYYIPYAVLAAMLIPAAFSSTGSLLTALSGIAVGVVLALCGRSLITVALAACLAAFLVGQIPF